MICLSHTGRKKEPNHLSSVPWPLVNTWFEVFPQLTIWWSFVSQVLWLRVDRTVCHLPPRSPCSPRSEEVERLSAAKRLVNNIIATELDFLNLTFLPDCSPSFQITTYTQLRELSSINLMLKAVSQENRTDRVASGSTHYIILLSFLLGGTQWRPRAKIIDWRKIWIPELMNDRRSQTVQPVFYNH